MRDVQDLYTEVWVKCEGCSGNGKYRGIYRTPCNQCTGCGFYWIFKGEDEYIKVDEKFVQGKTRDIMRKIESNQKEGNENK